MRAIVEKILSEAREEAEAIKREAKKTRKKVLAETRREAESLREKLVQEGKKRVDLEAEGLIREKRIELKKRQLEFKRKKLREVSEAALKELLNLKREKKERVFYSMILRLAEGGEEIIVSSADRTIFNPAFLDKLNRDLKKAGKKPVVLSREERGLKGGFILKKENFEVNASIEVLFNYLAEKEVRKIAQVLFGGGEE